MDCEEAKILLAPCILGDLDNDPRRRRELQAHLLCCPNCAEMHDGFQETIEFVLNHKAEFAQAFEKARARERKETVLAGLVDSETVASIKKSIHDYKPKVTVEEDWKDLCERCHGLGEKVSKQKKHQLVSRISSVAAGIVISLSTLFMFFDHLKNETSPENTLQAVAEQKPFLRVELLTKLGDTLVLAGEKISSGDELKTLLINGKHRMVMNVSTSLSIEPLVANTQLGCLVILDTGEIYTHVEHDGNPFIVETNSGKAVITGTVFNIKADNQQMELIVTEGSVRFENENGSVDVNAGQRSILAANTKPTLPALCDAKTLTSWATDYKPNTALAQTNSDDVDWYLALSLRTDPIVLVETDYYQWVEEKREWFKKNFSWIFELKDALIKEGIKVDYPELLIGSSDVWQFVCLEKFPARFSIPNFESMLRTVASYGFDKEWLLKNVPIAKIIQNESCVLQSSSRLAAFEQLLKYTNGTKAVPYYSYLADACKYLAETRSIIWFAVKDGKYDLTGEDRAEILVLLEEEVTAACNCQNDDMYPADEQEKSSCDDHIFKTMDERIIGYIKTMETVEEKIAEYEICR